MKKAKKKKAIRRHDCPYTAYGEPCQCNEDWLEEMFPEEWKEMGYVKD